MFILTLTYKKSIQIVDKYLAAHRAYLDEHYAKKNILCSGPRVPRTGGIIILTVNDPAVAQEIISQDPFYIHQVAHFEITEFTPVKYQEQLAPLISVSV